MWINPSTPSSSSAKAPNSVKFRMRAETTAPTLMRSESVVQGSGSTCFKLSEIRR